MIKDGIKINIYNTRQLMGAEAAIAVAGTITHLLQQQSEVNMVFAAAPSQNEFLDALVKQDIAWQHINAFHMDEYIGLPPTTTASFACYLQKHLFEKISCKTVNFINGNAANIGAECNRYGALINNRTVDIVCMGIGENNHLAFNDPPVANFNDAETIKAVELDEACRRQQVNDGCFAAFDDVPTHALTLTIPALLNCTYIFCIVPGERKAKAVVNTFGGGISEKYPSTALRKHNNVQLFLDIESSSLLH
jgi:glucosamine-6-phosphate deaminase